MNKMTQVTESDYRTAQQGDAKVRQEFIDAIDLEENIDFVENVRYESCRESLEANSCGLLENLKIEKTFLHIPSSYFFHIYFLNRFKSDGKKSEIRIYPSAFDFSYENFMSSLIDHEAFHARQCMTNSFGYSWATNERLRNKKSYVDRIYYYMLIEAPAVANQLANKNRELKSEDRAEVLDTLSLFLTKLNLLQNALQRPRNFKDDLKVISCNSAGDAYLNRVLGGRV
jgi:hypothetical protein